MKRIPLVLVLSVVALGSAFSWRAHQELTEQPLHVTGSDVPDARVVGGPDFAMKRAEELLVAYNAAGGDLGRIPRDLQVLPDQKFAEKEQNRDPHTSAWDFPTSQPEYSNVAFYTDLYARQNRSYYKGGRTVSNPTGFFIVAWKSGKIEKVPVERLRMSSMQTGGHRLFPGMPGYDTAAPDVFYTRTP